MHRQENTTFTAIALAAELLEKYLPQSIKEYFQLKVKIDNVSIRLLGEYTHEEHLPILRAYIDILKGRYPKLDGRRQFWETIESRAQGKQEWSAWFGCLGPITWPELAESWNSHSHPELSGQIHFSLFLELLKANQKLIGQVELNDYLLFDTIDQEAFKLLITEHNDLLKKQNQDEVSEKIEKAVQHMRKLAGLLKKMDQNEKTFHDEIKQQEEAKSSTTAISKEKATVVTKYLTLQCQVQGLTWKIKQDDSIFTEWKMLSTGSNVTEKISSLQQHIKSMGILFNFSRHVRPNEGMTTITVSFPPVALPGLFIHAQKILLPLQKKHHFVPISSRTFLQSELASSASVTIGTNLMQLVDRDTLWPEEFRALVQGKNIAHIEAIRDNTGKPTDVVGLYMPAAKAEYAKKLFAALKEILPTATLEECDARMVDSDCHYTSVIKLANQTDMKKLILCSCGRQRSQQYFEDYYSTHSTDSRLNVSNKSSAKTEEKLVTQQKKAVGKTLAPFWRQKVLVLGEIEFTRMLYDKPFHDNYTQATFEYDANFLAWFTNMPSKPIEVAGYSVSKTKENTIVILQEPQKMGIEITREISKFSKTTSFFIVVKNAYPNIYDDFMRHDLCSLFLQDMFKKLKMIIARTQQSIGVTMQSANTDNIVFSSNNPALFKNALSTTALLLQSTSTMNTAATGLAHQVQIPLGDTRARANAILEFSKHLSLQPRPVEHTATQRLGPGLV